MQAIRGALRARAAVRLVSAITASARLGLGLGLGLGILLEALAERHVRRRACARTAAAATLERVLAARRARRTFLDRQWLSVARLAPSRRRNGCLVPCLDCRCILQGVTKHVVFLLRECVSRLERGVGRFGLVRCIGRVLAHPHGHRVSRRGHSARAGGAAHERSRLARQHEPTQALRLALQSSVETLGEVRAHGVLGSSERSQPCRPLSELRLEPAAQALLAAIDKGDRRAIACIVAFTLAAPLILPAHVREPAPLGKGARPARVAALARAGVEAVLRQRAPAALGDHAHALDGVLNLKVRHHRCEAQPREPRPQHLLLVE